MLLKRSRNCRFAGSREAGEPYSASFLLAKLAALFAGEARVPCNVAGRVLGLWEASCGWLDYVRCHCLFGLNFF